MAEIEIKPLGDFIFVLPKEIEKTSSGIIIPESVKERPHEGTVVVVGPGTKDKPMSLKAGDRVLFNSYSTQTYKKDDKTFLIMRESDVYAIVG